MKEYSNIPWTCAVKVLEKKAVILAEGGEIECKKNTNKKIENI